ncbi:hypothetical protein FOCC_FOCC002269, partial [Frankliniella occidentalis]
MCAEAGSGNIEDGFREDLSARPGVCREVVASEGAGEEGQQSQFASLVVPFFHLQYNDEAESEPDMIATKPLVTQAELERYLPPRTCHQLDLDDYSSRLDSPENVSPLPLSPLPLSPLPPLTQTQLTQADLEEYARTCDDALALRPHHQQQGSYAQSEGYHSYVSSSDSTTTAPFLDSASSSETLKWHGSLSDVSVASSALGLVTQRQQLIAHSSRVQTAQRHHSESVLYLGGGGTSPMASGSVASAAGNASPLGGRADRDREERNNERNQRRLFPVSTYTVLPEHQDNRVA